METITLNFHCPRYDELPDYGLYLDQVLSLLNTALAPISSDTITGAMISNFVKNKNIPAPERKKYKREHLCYLMVTAILKQMFSLQQVAAFFEIQRRTYSLEVAYNYFCEELENALQEAFCFTGNALPSIETKRTEQTILMRSIVLAAANRIYVEKIIEQQ